MLSSWFKTLFTEEPERRSQLMLTLLAVGLIAYCAALGLYAAPLAGADPKLTWIWVLCSVAGLLIVFAAIRVGWTRHFADPALTSLQMVFGITSSAIGYALVGPMRAAAFPPLMIIMIFGLFSLRPRVVAAIALYAVLLMGAVMAFKSHQDPLVYPADIEMGHFLMFAAMVPVVPMLAMRFAAIRARQARQRHDLLRVQELASRDELTGLVNRRQMTVLLQRAQVAHARSGWPYCIAVIDLDHFKRVNDKYGHGTGDEVLRRFAEITQTVTRDNDTLARWGGEEFVLLLGDSQISSARAGVDRIREHIAAHAMTIGPHRLSMTISAGIAEPLEGESFERVLSRADHALYVAKARGRNAVVTA